MTERKICTKCNAFKFLKEYDKAKNRPMGVKSACKDCERPVKQKHYKNNKEKYKQSYQEFILRNPNYQQEYYKKKTPNSKLFL